MSRLIALVALLLMPARGWSTQIYTVSYTVVVQPTFCMITDIPSLGRQIGPNHYRYEFQGEGK